MFDLLVSGIQAYNQVGFFFGSWIFLTIGGLLAGNAFYWRVHSLRATGTIIGVVPNGKLFAPVYRYTLADGQTHVAKANISSNMVRGMKTGRTVRLLVSPHNPSDARQAGDWTGEIIGLVFMLPGAWLGWIALTAFPLTPMTGLMAAGFVAYFAERGVRTFKRNGPHLSIADWLTLIRQGVATDVDLSAVKPIESLVPAETMKKSWREQIAGGKKAAAFVALIALVMLGIGVFQTVRVLRYETQGVRANGVVVDLAESDNSDGGWTYHAIVRFRVPGGTVQFKDDIGGDPPPLRPGAEVSVLYLPDQPSHAIVDRGFENVLIPLLVMAGCIFLTWLAWVLWMSGAGAATGTSADPASVPAE